MMPAAKRASYFLFSTFHSAAPSPRGSTRSQESPGKDMPLACNGRQKVAKNKSKKCQYIEIQYISTF